VANVLMLDWKLLSDERFGQVIYSRVIQFAINSAFFQDEWEKQIEKN
jgi:hypothetical protein